MRIQRNVIALIAAVLLVQSACAVEGAAKEARAAGEKQPLVREPATPVLARVDSAPTPGID